MNDTLRCFSDNLKLKLPKKQHFLVDDVLNANIRKYLRMKIR